MTARATSIEAYRSHSGLSRQSAGVFDYIKQHPGCTRRQVALGTGFDLSAVSGRVHEFIKDGAVVECGKVICPVTGRTVMALRVVPAQAELFREAA